MDFLRELWEACEACEAGRVEDVQALLLQDPQFN